MKKDITKKCAFVVLFLIHSVIGLAQPASWIIDPTAFEYSATFNCQVVLPDVTVEESDYVAAFINGEVRGVVQALNNPNLNQLFFLLIVYSSEVSGESISFKFFDASQNEEIILEQDLAFEADLVTGSFSNPVLLSANPDVIRPTVQITSSATDPTNIFPIPLSVTFSEEVTGFALIDVIVGNGVSQNLQTSDNITFTMDIAPTANGTVTVNIDANAAQDLASNGNEVASTYQISYFGNYFIWDGETSMDWSTATNWLSNTVPSSTDDVIIPEVDNDPVITTDIVLNTVNIYSGAILSISSNSLTVRDLTIIDGSLSISSGASLAPLGVVDGIGSALVHRSTTFGVSEGRYSVIGSPITAGNTSSLGSIVYSYDETVGYDPGGTDGSARFIRVSSPQNMNVGDGYFSANTGDITFSGTPNSGDISFGMVYDEANDGGEATYAGFNLISNPYTAAISYLHFMDGNEHIDGTIYFWDDGGADVSQRTNADYITANSMGAASGGSSRAANWDGAIRSTQGFFVKATSADLLHFSSDMMIEGNNSDIGFFREPAPTVLRFSISSETQFNEILVGFKEEATVGFDRALDAYKIKGNSDLHLYSKMGESNLAIQALPILTGEVVVPLGFDIAEAGDYSFTLSDVASNHILVYLMDHELNKIVDISEGSYAFESAAVTHSERFSLVFSRDILSTANVLQNHALKVFSKDGMLHIRMEQALTEAQVKIYNLIGTLIKQIDDVHFAGQDIQTHMSDTGIYIITVQNSDQLFIKKFLNR